MNSANKNNTSPSYFKEVQRFTQWWIWIILAIICFPTIIGLYKQLVLHTPWGNNPMSDTGLICLSLFLFLITAFILSIQLKTEIDDKAINMHFSPLLKKQIKWEDIRSVRIVNYGFVGGWGIRLCNRKYGTIFNIKGNKGLSIVLHNGKKLLIGTQQENKLKDIIKTIQENKL